MNTVCDIDMCAGCMLCFDCCPHNAITIKKSFQAYNAVIDESKCIDCNLCHKLCQANHCPDFKAPIYWAQGWANDEKIRNNASSGGFATALELAFVKMGGIVFSCTYRNGDFIFECAETVEDVSKFSGSKYVKSNPSGVYKTIKHYLMIGRKVLFVGLPCQVAAVLNFCGSTDNLYTVDLICHGTPSPELLFIYLGENNIEKSSIQSVSFRVKTKFRLEQNHKSLTNPRISDCYTATFLNGTTYTENCYVCRYARSERISDITLGDSWGSDLDEEQQVKGISLVLAQTVKGKNLIKASNLVLKDVSLEKSIRYNHQLEYPSSKNLARSVFFTEIDNSESFCKAYRKAFPKQYRKDVVKRLLLKLHLLGGVKNRIWYRLVVEIK